MEGFIAATPVSQPSGEDGEHVYLSRGLGGGSLTLAYSTDEDPEADFGDVDPGAAEADVRRYTEETRRADAAIAAMPSLDSVGAGHGRSLRWTLIKMVQEYAVHNGQAHIIRYAALES